MVAEQELLADPLITTVFATLGPSGDVNKVSMRVVTLPKQERSVGILALEDKVRSIVAKIPESKIVITDPSFIEGAASQAPIMVLCRGTSYEDLAPYANQVAAALEGSPA